jgi:hypothetical protein
VAAGKPRLNNREESAVTNTDHSNAPQPELFFYSKQRWRRQDGWGNQRSADEFGRVVFTHVPRHAKDEE